MKQYTELYQNKRWRETRLVVFDRDEYKCQSCNRYVGGRLTPIADHIKPHKGDTKLFWDMRNLQTMCKPCHDSHKQSLEKGGHGRPAIGVDGWPVN